MVRKLVLLALLIAAFSASALRASARTASLAVEYANQANALGPDVMRFAGLSFTHPVTLEVVQTELMRQIIADDLALTMPGFSSDPAARKAVYAAAQIIAVRYSLSRRRFYVCQASWAAGLKQAMLPEPESGAVFRLLMACELMRALEDQRFDLAGGFRRDRQATSAACIRTLMDGFASHALVRLAGDWGVSQDMLAVAQSWCDGRLEKRDPAQYPAYAEGSLQTLGRNFISSLYERKGLPAIIRAFQQPPRQLEQFLNPPKWIAGAFPPPPDPGRIKSELLQATRSLPCKGWNIEWLPQERLLGQMGTAAASQPFDSAWISGGVGLKLTRPGGIGEVQIILIQWAEPGRITPEDGLLRCLGHLQESAAALGTALQPGAESATVEPSCRIIVRQAQFIQRPRIVCPGLAAAGLRDCTSIFLTAYGEPFSNDQAATIVRLVLESLAAVLK